MIPQIVADSVNFDDAVNKLHFFSDGVYEISGTIGQPDAGNIVIADYVVEGGFWSDLEAAPERAPCLLIELVAPGSVLVSWPAPSSGFV